MAGQPASIDVAEHEREWSDPATDNGRTHTDQIIRGARHPDSPST